MPEYVVTRIQTWRIEAWNAQEAEQEAHDFYMAGDGAVNWQVEEVPVREGTWLGRLEPDENPDDVRTEEDA